MATSETKSIAQNIGMVLLMKLYNLISCVWYLLEVVSLKEVVNFMAQ